MKPIARSLSILCLIWSFGTAQPSPATLKESLLPDDKIEKLAVGLIAEIRAKVAAKAPPKDFDPILEKLNEIPMINVQVPIEQIPGRFTMVKQLPPKLEAARRFVTAWQEYLNDRANDAYFSARQKLLYIGQQSTTGYSVLPRSELMALQESMAVEENAAKKRVTAGLIEELGNAMLAGETVQDFNSVIRKIDEVAEKTRGDPGVGMILSALKNHASTWRNHFAMGASPGLDPEKLASLVNLLNSDSNEYAVELQKKAALRLKKFSPAAAATKVTAGPLDPNDLRMENLDDYISAGRNDGGNGTAFLNSLSMIRTRLANGDLQAVFEFYGARSNGGFNTPPAFDAAVERLRTRLVLDALAIQFKTAGLKPKADSTVADFLALGIEAEIKAKRWNAVIEALQVGQQLNPRRQNNYDLAAFQKLVVGINQERARQFADAKRSYLEALAMPGTYIPVDELNERLNSKEIAQIERAVR